MGGGTIIPARCNALFYGLWRFLFLILFRLDGRPLRCVNHKPEIFSVGGGGRFPKEGATVSSAAFLAVFLFNSAQADESVKRLKVNVSVAGVTSVRTGSQGQSAEEESAETCPPLPLF